MRDFVPDYTFAGSQLAGWHTVGKADWQAINGEIVGKAPVGSAGGWLVFDKPFQDMQLFTRFKCDAPCRTGFMVRAAATADGGLQGYFVSVAEDDYTPYLLTLDRDGNEVSREQLRRGPVQLRLAPPPDLPSSGKVAPAYVVGKPGVSGGPAPAANVQQLADLQPPPLDIQHGEWNELSATMDANVLRPNLNWANQIGFVATKDDSLSHGPFALYVGPGSEVHFKDTSYKDLNRRIVSPEQVSPRFHMQRLEEYAYAWDTAVGDFNHDGVKDVVAGPFIYLGPNYTERHEIYLSQTISPSTEYISNMITFAGDFTGDGWDDILATEYRQMVLYVNPHDLTRRWDRYLVVPGVTSELTVLRDLDGDGKPELVFVKGGRIVFAKFDPAHPTAEWKTYPVSDTGLTTVHGLGVGDINGDGRPDILNASGWWEQPAEGATSGPWKYHPYAFARWSRSEGAGGGLMSVWDVNGDGLPDVVTSLNAHGWGLAWFEQKRDAQGNITFVRHMIMDDFTTANAGGLTFSELHSGVVPVDIDGDGVMDFVTGKRYWAHRESYTDPDPNGPAYLVWYRCIRNPKAPGGAEFIPEVIHNRSGVGSGFKVADLNGDGAPDIITANNRGTFIFWGKQNVHKPGGK